MKYYQSVVFSIALIVCLAVNILEAVTDSVVVARRAFLKPGKLSKIRIKM